jgi:hypothetical protein
VLALRAWNHLATGMGGIDWAGLPIVAELLGFDDPEALIELLLTIKTHKPGADAPGINDQADGDRNPLD